MFIIYKNVISKLQHLVPQIAHSDGLSVQSLAPPAKPWWRYDLERCPYCWTFERESISPGWFSSQNISNVELGFNNLFCYPEDATERAFHLPVILDCMILMWPSLYMHASLPKFKSQVVIDRADINTLVFKYWKYKADIRRDYPKNSPCIVLYIAALEGNKRCWQNCVVSIMVEVIFSKSLRNILFPFRKW